MDLTAPGGIVFREFRKCLWNEDDPWNEYECAILDKLQELLLTLFGKRVDVKPGIVLEENLRSETRKISIHSKRCVHSPHNLLKQPAAAVDSSSKPILRKKPKLTDQSQASGSDRTPKREELGQMTVESVGKNLPTTVQRSSKKVRPASSTDRESVSTVKSRPRKKLRSDMVKPEELVTERTLTQEVMNQVVEEMEVDVVQNMPSPNLMLRSSKKVELEPSLTVKSGPRKKVHSDAVKVSGDPIIQLTAVTQETFVAATPHDSNSVSQYLTPQGDSKFNLNLSRGEAVIKLNPVIFPEAPASSPVSPSIDTARSSTGSSIFNTEQVIMVENTTTASSSTQPLPVEERHPTNCVAEQPVKKNISTKPRKSEKKATEPPSLADPAPSLNRSDLSSKRPFGVSRLYHSAERLGGTCRLGSMTSTSHTVSRPAAKMSRINDSNKVPPSAQRTGGSTARTTERTSGLMAMEQRLAQKQRAYLARMEQKEERVRAMQEAKQREREAQKLANEQRRLAVKAKAQQMAECQRAIWDSKMALSKDQARLKLDAIKENVPPHGGRPAPVAGSALNTTQTPNLMNTTMSKLKPAPVASSNDAGSGLVKAVMNVGKTVLKAIQPSNTNVVTGTAATTTNHEVVPKSKITPVNTTKPTTQSGAAGAMIKPVSINQTFTANMNESFNISLLCSDSESDEEDHKRPPRAIPSWSRRGTRELLEMIQAVYRGDLRWQEHFIQPSQIPFSVDEMFHGYHYTRRPRTSSRIWTHTPDSTSRSPPSRQRLL